MQRYFHLRATGNSKGGATLFAKLSEDDKNTILVGIARCGPDDTFSRTVGREKALADFAIKLRRVPIAALPNLLQRLQREVISRSVVRNPATGKWVRLSRSKRKNHPLWNHDFDFALKYFGWAVTTVEPEGNPGAPLRDNVVVFGKIAKAANVDGALVH